MVRTQVQLPDELYQRAKAFAIEREISLAEVTRRGIELFLERFPKRSSSSTTWRLPRIDAGEMKISLEELKEVTREEESLRGIERG